MRTGLPVPARIAIQMWMVIPIGAFGIVAAPSTLSAQVTVSYPSGIYGQYRRDLSDYGSRALTLLEDIAKIDINATYCTSADRANVNAELEALGARQAQLTRDYTAFKQRIESSSETSSIMTAFNAAGDNPKQENFWANADREILTHPQSDLSFKLAQLKKSTVVDCNPKPVKKVVTAPPPKPKTTAPNPLAGLTRPTLIPRPPFPVAPAFCSLNERDTWVKANIAPLMDANAKITWALTRISHQQFEMDGGSG